jgi:hypothetical protein
MQATLGPHQAPRPPAKPRWVVSARKMLRRCVVPTPCGTPSLSHRLCAACLVGRVWQDRRLLLPSQHQVHRRESVVQSVPALPAARGVRQRVQRPIRGGQGQRGALVVGSSRPLAAHGTYPAAALCCAAPHVGPVWWAQLAGRPEHHRLQIVLPRWRRLHLRQRVASCCSCSNRKSLRR